MLHLYHAGPSVCSVKVRIGLAEKKLAWQDHPIAIDKGEQFAPDYLKLNPNAVVPTLVDENFVVRESSIILEYIDQLCDKTTLMPNELKAQTTTKLWLLRCLDIHAAINTLTFATVMRYKILANKTAKEIEASIAKIPNKNAAMKRRDLINSGLDSTYIENDLNTLKTVFTDMQASLSNKAWLMGDEYSMADTALIAYIDRINRLGFDGLWEENSPEISRWLAQSKARNSYAQAVTPYISNQAAQAMLHTAKNAWPALKEQWACI